MRLLTNKNFAGDGMRVMLSLASVVVIIAGLRAAAPMIIPVLLAIFLATASFPITSALTRIRIPRAIAVAITVIIDCGFLVGLGFLMNYLAGDLKRTIVIKYHPLFMEKYGELAAWLRKHNLEDALDGVGDLLNIHNIMTISSQAFRSAAVWLSLIVLVLILMTFFLGEARLFRKNVAKISSQEGPDFQKVIKAATDIQRYLFIKTMISLTTGLLSGLLCYFTKLDFPLLWGILAFALNYIPTIGSIVAAIPPIVLALILGSPATALVVGIGYIAINMCLGNFLEPLLMGKQFGIATAVVLLSVIFWGWILGPIGMLLAVPLTMIMKLAFENSRDLKWVATLLSDTPDENPEQEGPPASSPSTE